MDTHFGARILALLAVAIVLSGIDFYKNRGQSTAWREYGFIILTGVLGAVVGAVNDSITSAISPDYFVFGKGLSGGPSLHTQAIEYGAQVGFSGGGVSGAILTFVARRKSKTPPTPFAFLLRLLWIPVSGAIFFALTLPLLASRFDPFGIDDQLKNTLTPDQLAAFLRVWWIHVGIYSGLLVGVCLVLTLVIKRRSASAVMPHHHE